MQYFGGKKTSVLEYIYDRLRTKPHARLKELCKYAAPVLMVDQWWQFLHEQAARMMGSWWNRMNNLPGLNIAKRPKVNIIMSAIICQEVTTYRGNQHIDFLKSTLWNICRCSHTGSNHTPLTQTVEGLRLLNYAQTCHPLNIESQIHLCWCW
jgi:hypothetical protein